MPRPVPNRFEDEYGAPPAEFAPVAPVTDGCGDEERSERQWRAMERDDETREAIEHWREFG